MNLQKSFLILFLFVSSGLCNTELNTTLKQKLQVEIAGLQEEISNASKDIVQLKADKASLEAALKNMEEWGTSQESAKLQYYEEAGNLELQAAQASEALASEKKHTEETLRKYYRLKQIMGYLAGTLLFGLYQYFGSRIVLFAQPALGPWGALLQYIGPVAAFGIGYLLVKMFF